MAKKRKSGKSKFRRRGGAPIRANQGQASYLEAVAGKTYQVSIRASGGMNLRLIDE